MKTFLAFLMLLMPGISKAQIMNNKEIIRTLYDQALNKRNFALFKDYVSADFTGVQGTKGPEGFASNVVPLINAFPDIRWEIEDLIEEGNKIVVRWKWEGTQTAQFRNIAATGKKITNTAIAIYEFTNGKIINVHVQTDRLGFLQELDVLPVDINAKDQVSFIDKFLVPAAAKATFLERVKINRDFIRTLPGFIHDAAYEYTDNSGNLIFITVAIWANKEVLDKAKEAVFAMFKKQNFDPAEMYKKLNISVDRGIYSRVSN